MNILFTLIWCICYIALKALTNSHSEAGTRIKIGLLIGTAGYISYPLAMYLSIPILTESFKVPYMEVQFFVALAMSIFYLLRALTLMIINKNKNKLDIVVESLLTGYAIQIKLFYFTFVLNTGSVLSEFKSVGADSKEILMIFGTSCVILVILMYVIKLLKSSSERK